MPTYLALLERMVGINSFSANPAGVNALGDLTAALFAGLGFTAERVPCTNPRYGHHLLLTRPGRSGRALALISHLDTVFSAEEEARNHFAWRVEGDRVYGPGTEDIKGGTVLIYMMMAALRELQPEVYEDVTWRVLLDAAEEADMHDFGDLCLQRLGPETLACLVFEGGRMAGHEFTLVGARKGMAVYQVTVEGKGAHAGVAHPNGANAIVQMADVIQRIAGFTDYGRDLTFNVGVVAGGTVVNRVPHFAAASVEMRAFDADVFEGGLANMMALNDLVTVQSSNGNYPCKVNVELLRRTPPWPRNDGTHRLLGLWREAAAELGFKLATERRGGLSDGNQIWHRFPTLDGLGPSGDNAHCSERSADGSKDQEYATISSFVPKALLNVMAILKLIERG